MLEITGYYYLHTDGDLIFKKFRPEADSDFVRRVWQVFHEDRECAWIICIEALLLGANKNRVKELQVKWGLTNDDALEFARRMNLRIYLDGDQWCTTYKDFINLQESLAGFGVDALTAFVDLMEKGGNKVFQRGGD